MGKKRLNYTKILVGHKKRKKKSEDKENVSKKVIMGAEEVQGADFGESKKKNYTEARIKKIDTKDRRNA